MRANKAISLTTAGLVFLVALGSFALSYNALRDMAIRNGIEGTLSYVWPLLIDLALIVFSLSVVNSYLQSETTKKQWALVGVYTVATIGFNVAHAPSSFQAQIVAAIAPISLFFSFELLMSQLGNSVKRSSLVQSIEQLEQALEQKRSDFDRTLERMRSTLRQRFEQERSNLTAEIEQLSNELNGLRSTVQELSQEIEQKRSTSVQLQEEIAELERSKMAAKIVQSDVLNEVSTEKLNSKEQALNALLNFYRSNPHATLNEAGTIIERSKGTVSNYLNELEQAGLIHRNGEGVKVLQ